MFFLLLLILAPKSSVYLLIYEQYRPSLDSQQNKANVCSKRLLTHENCCPKHFFTKENVCLLSKVNVSDIVRKH